MSTSDELRTEIESTHPIEQTPPDWLNEFDTREEAWAAWIDSLVEIAVASK